MTSTDSNKKKLLDRKTEEAVSLAQKSGHSDLIPSWYKAPEDINPPETVPSPSPSEAAPLEALEALLSKASVPRRRKKNKNKNKKKAHPQQSLGSQHADGGLGTVAAEAWWWSVHPGKNKHQHHPQNSPWSAPCM